MPPTMAPMGTLLPELSGLGLGGGEGAGLMDGEFESTDSTDCSVLVVLPRPVAGAGAAADAYVSAKQALQLCSEFANDERKQGAR